MDDPLPEPLDEDMEVAEELEADEEPLELAEVLEAEELSWATAPLAAKAARRATGTRENFILLVIWLRLRRRRRKLRWKDDG